MFAPPYGAPGWVAAAVRDGSARSGATLAAAISNLSSPLHRHHLAALDRRGGAVVRPCFHEPAALLEHASSLVSLLDLTADGVCERNLDDLVLK